MRSTYGRTDGQRDARDTRSLTHSEQGPCHGHPPAAYPAQHRPVQTAGDATETRTDCLTRYHAAKLFGPHANEFKSKFSCLCKQIRSDAELRDSSVAVAR